MARTNNLTNFLTDVANAIKDKKGNQTDIQASQFDTEIRNLPSGGTYQQKSTTITQNGTTTITPDAGYDAMDEVTVTTAVPLQTRNYSFTQNTTTTLTPEQGYAGFSSVGLTIDVPSSGIDTSDATAVAINIRDGETAYARGSKITGTLPVLTYPINPERPSDTSYQFIAATASSNVTRDGTKYLMGTYQIASQSQPDSWMFEGNRKMKLGIPFSMVVSRGSITANKIKKGVTIYGVTGTYEGSTDTIVYLDYLDINGCYFDTGINVSGTKGMEITLAVNDAGHYVYFFHQGSAVSLFPWDVTTKELTCVLLNSSTNTEVFYNNEAYLNASMAYTQNKRAYIKISGASL